MKNNNITVLVTGANGYIASILINDLINYGYNVRGTVRGDVNNPKYAFLYDISKTNKIKLYTCDLLNGNGWDNAINGCDYVFHTASPTFKIKDINKNVTLDSKYYVDPPIIGIKYILDACKKYNVKRIIYTSSGSTCVEYITKNGKGKSLYIILYICVGHVFV